MKIEKQIEFVVVWIRDHRERFWALLGGVALSGLLIALVLRHRQTESSEAWFQLGNVQGELMQDKYEETRKGLEGWEGRFQGTDAATYEKFIKADLLYKTSNFAEASKLYGELSQTGQPDLLKPLALSAQASSEEMLGHIPEALSLGKTFLDRYPDHFLSAERYMANGRLLEMTNDFAGAAAVYDRFVLLFPQSPWTAMAKDRSQALRQTVPPAAPR